MKVSSNMTISQLISKGEEQIHSQFEPESNELVGFGKHGDMTYAQVMEQHPSYIQWERRFGKGAAIRLAEWNGADLETEAGVQLAMQKVRKLRPVHLWISTECGPFCPLQRLNRRTPEQCKNLQEKQDKVKLQYQGALRVAEQGWQVGTQVHWEWAQKSEAWSWSLDFFQDYEHQHSLKRVDCNGCTVELRTRDGKQALCKAWRVSTRY